MLDGEKIKSVKEVNCLQSIENLTSNLSYNMKPVTTPLERCDRDGLPPRNYTQKNVYLTGTCESYGIRVMYVKPPLMHPVQIYATQIVKSMILRHMGLNLKFPEKLSPLFATVIPS
ncbi:hypothetical protein TNCT_207561 [Trichonephila clavata]|uniref:Uncharacterized protein n=1 Tax=Trichonephila clavata TaxID=2740835 RepID=A0A8X6FE02_TRICU|nr:hypothetical protein TNCT_207561 [Trichonephila clavata]